MRALVFIFFLSGIFLSGKGYTEEKSHLPVKPLESLIYYQKQQAPARVISLNDATISARIDAEVQGIPVLVGDIVSKGDTLVRLDCTDQQIQFRITAARLKASEARLQLASSNLVREEKLLTQNLSAQELKDARQADKDIFTADIQAARAEHNLAELAVSRCEVKAPFDGLVTERLVSPGHLTVKGTPLIALIDQNTVELSAQVSDAAAPQLFRANSIHFSNRKDWPVTVRQVLPAVNSETRNREIRLEFTGEKPLPGAAGKLIWEDPRPFLPARYIVSRQGKLGVFLAKNEKAVFLPVIAAHPGRDCPVELPLDTQMVFTGLATLNDGDSLTGENQ